MRFFAASPKIVRACLCACRAGVAAGIGGLSVRANSRGQLGGLVWELLVGVETGAAEVSIRVIEIFEVVVVNHGMQISHFYEESVEP